VSLRICEGIEVDQRRKGDYTRKKEGVHSGSCGSLIATTFGKKECHPITVTELRNYRITVSHFWGAVQSCHRYY
jgi:hypothetical protein